MNPVNKQFISEIDQKLQEFNQNHPKSSSQQAEIKKYQSIHQLRDSSVSTLNQPIEKNGGNHDAVI